MLLLLLLVMAVTPPEPPESQTLVVTTASWTATVGEATLYEEGEPVLGPAPVHVGYAGLGWGRGLHSTSGLVGPQKREGDGRAPAGIFEVGHVWRRWYSQQVWCVDDMASPDYTRILSRPAAQKKWSTDEHMADYRLAVVIRHNPERKPGAGSCIFLHDGAEPTVGCSAFEPALMDQLVGRLRSGARFVQLPREVYGDKRAAWKLPSLITRAEPGPSTR